MEQLPYSTLVPGEVALGETHVHFFRKPDTVWESLLNKWEDPFVQIIKDEITFRDFYNVNVSRCTIALKYTRFDGQIILHVIRYTNSRNVKKCRSYF